MCQATGIEGGRDVRLQSKRLIAVSQRAAQVADDSADPASPIPRAFQGGLEPNCLAVIPQRATIFAGFPVSFSSVREDGGRDRVKPYRSIKIFDRLLVLA